MFDEYLLQNDLRALLTAPYRPCPPRQDRAAWHALSDAIRDELLRWGDEARNGYPMLTATQFLAFSRTGDRQVFEQPYFGRRKLLMGAALAECAADDGRHMDAVIDGLWCICEETSWVISAHNHDGHTGVRPLFDRPLPDAENPNIDLFAAQTAAALADTLYLLEDKLDLVSPVIARRVRQEIERRVIGPFLRRDDFWWMGIIRRDVNNWTPWIISNVLEAALLLERDAVRRAEIVARGLRMLDSYLAVLPEDGGCDEGAGYFNMAGASLFDCLESVYQASGGRVSFYGEPFIRRIGEFPVKAHIAGPVFLNFADCDLMPYLDGDRLYLYGLRTGSQRLMALGSTLHAGRMADPANIRPKDTPQMSRVLSALFADVPPAAPVTPPFFEAMPDLQVFVWRGRDLTLACKGGHNEESHNHNDVGSFMVYADGQPAVVDVGNRVYTAKTFGPDRYTLDNTRSMNHNVPLIGGCEQAAGRSHAARDVQADDRGVSMELADAYPAEAGVQSLKREISFDGATIRLHDRIRLTRPQEATWVFMLKNRPEYSSGEAHFGPLTLRFDPSLRCAAEEWPVTDARMARNFPGSLWRLTLTAAPAPEHKQTMTLTRR